MRQERIAVASVVCWPQGRPGRSYAHDLGVDNARLVVRRVVPFPLLRSFAKHAGVDRFHGSTGRRPTCSWDYR